MGLPAGHGRRGERPGLEVADIFRAYGDRLSALSPHQERTVHAITSCRTAALGGHVNQCDRCGYRETSYNSCRNRHCPKCQALDQVRWVEEQREVLLPTEYHHVVFTVAQELHPLLRANPRVGYGLLLKAAAETLQEVAARPRNLGARIGFTTVLHTWSQTLSFHPHVHCIVPGGGLSFDRSRWISAKPGYFLCVHILMLVFRAKLLRKLQDALDAGEITCTDGSAPQRLRQASCKKWEVYSKPSFADREAVVRYLSRYTHRIAISNHRLVSTDNGNVTFQWRDRADDNNIKEMTLPAEEFLRRFLLHLLPPRFMRIRHYGLLANAQRKKNIALCRHLLADQPDTASSSQVPDETWQDLILRLTGEDVTMCPRCRIGHLVTVEQLRPVSPPQARSRAP